MTTNAVRIVWKCATAPKGTLPVKFLNNGTLLLPVFCFISFPVVIAITPPLCKLASTFHKSERTSHCDL